MPFGHDAKLFLVFAINLPTSNFWCPLVNLEVAVWVQQAAAIEGSGRWGQFTCYPIRRDILTYSVALGYD